MAAGDLSYPSKTVTPATYARTMPEDLTDTEKALLDIFARPMGYNPRAAAIMKATGLSSPAAMVRLNQLVDTEAALAYKPTLVNHLRNLRAQGLQRHASNRA